MVHTRKLGSQFEDIAAKFLKTKGYNIIKRNFHSHYGEIDLIAIHEKALVFIEVKARRSLLFGSPEEAVTPRKIERISQTGQIFRSVYKGNLPEASRIDVVAILHQPTENKYSIKLISGVY